MKIWNGSVELTCHMLYHPSLKVSAETVPTPEGEPQDWAEGDVVQEGDIVIEIGFRGYEAHPVVAGKPSTGMGSRNYNPATGGEWKLGHRD